MQNRTYTFFGIILLREEVWGRVGPVSHDIPINGNTKVLQALHFHFSCFHGIILLILHCQIIKTAKLLYSKRTKGTNKNPVIDRVLDFKALEEYSINY